MNPHKSNDKMWFSWIHKKQRVELNEKKKLKKNKVYKEKKTKTRTNIEIWYLC